jgi:hypothetical protein
MSTSTVYSTSRGINQGGGTTTTTVRAENNGYDWLYYVVYFLIAVLVIWGILFILIKTGVVGPNDWLYENTKWIPIIGEKSWARQTSNAAGNRNG